MSRILKRPMFRRGGSTNTGIMSGLVDRRNYKEGRFGSMTEDEIRSNIDLLRGLQDQFAPLPKTRLPLGEVGLALASGAPIIDALSLGYRKFVSDDDKRRALAAKRDQAAVSSVLGQALKKDEIGTLKQGRNTSNQTLFGVKPGETGFFTAKQLVAGQGLIQPIDTRMAFTFDADTNTLSQRPVSEIDAMNENKRNAQQIASAVNTVGDLKNNMIERVKNAPTGAVAGVFGAIEGISDQLSQVSESLGFNQNSLDFDVNTSEKLDKYLADKGVTRGATEFAKLKSSVINLAYNLAKIKEPGNPRLSEGDIIRQLDRIKFGQSRDVFIGALNQIYDDEVIGARGQIKGYGLDPNDFFGTSKKTPSTQKGGKGADTNDPAGIRQFIN
tara:strand:- start:450 stop:1604 length:1155 start_codon:yes stop_codon:yes gene_type:complete